MQAAKQVAALCVLLPFLASCATWQDGIRRSLRGLSEGTEQAIGTANTTCEQVMQMCVASKTNPCPNLDKCLGIRSFIVKAAVMAQLVALAGYAAVDLADKPRAEEALKEGLRLFAAVKKALEALK